MILNKYSCSDFYETKRISENKFEVEFNETFDSVINKEDFNKRDKNDFMIASLPLFRCVHIVTVNADNTMSCSCCEYEVCGLFCEHQVCVAKFVYHFMNKSFPGFSHWDIALQYTSPYMHLAYRVKTPPTLQKLFDQLIDNEKKGPRLGIELQRHVPIKPPSPKLSAVDRLKNYSKECAILPENYFDDAHISEYKPSRLDFLFSESIENFEINPESRCGSQELLKEKVDLVCKLADCIGPDGVKELDRLLDSFAAWAVYHERDSSLDDDFSNDKLLQDDIYSKRKFVPMTQGSYNGSNKRVFNTKHM